MESCRGARKGCGRVKIHFRLKDDTERVIEADERTSVMRVAVTNGIPGIDGECGGELNCGTCHVYIEGDWMDRLPAPDMYEEALIESVNDPRDNSRLSCQIDVTPDLDGLTVYVAE